MTPEPRATPELVPSGGSETPTEELEGTDSEPKLRIWAPRTGEVDGPEHPATRAKRDVHRPGVADKGRRLRPTSSAATTAVAAEGESTEEPPARSAGRARRARRVVRVVRRIELWSVLKVALLVFSCSYVAALGAVVLMWGGANSTGLVEALESFLGDVGFQDFTFDGELMFRRVAAIGGILVITLSVLAVLFTSLVNLVSELTGGIRVVIIEEEPLEP